MHFYVVSDLSLEKQIAVLLGQTISLSQERTNEARYRCLSSLSDIGLSFNLKSS